MTASSSSFALLLLLLVAVSCRGEYSGDSNKTDSEKTMPFVPLHAEQGLTRGDASHGPASKDDNYGAMKPPGYAGSATNKGEYLASQIYLNGYCCDFQTLPKSFNLYEAYSSSTLKGTVHP